MRSWHTLAAILLLGCHGAVEDAGLEDASTDRISDSTTRVPKVHRASAAPCTAPRGPGTWKDSHWGPYDGGCASDDECTAGLNGRCGIVGQMGPGVDVLLCTYDQCTTDQDCPGKVCRCRNEPPFSNDNPTWHGDRGLNMCAGGNCRVDLDCKGQYCSPSYLWECVGSQGWVSFYCHTSSDECVDDSDCANAEAAGAVCIYDPNRLHWVCSNLTCADGG